MTHLYPSGTGRCRTCNNLLQYCACPAVEHPVTAKHASIIKIGGVWTVYDDEQPIDWVGVSDQRLDDEWAQWERLNRGSDE